MEFKLFVDNVADMVQERLGRDYEIRVTNVVKNNNIHMTGIVLMKKPGNIAPTIYLEHPYQEYCHGAALNDVVEQILELYEDQIQERYLDMDFFTDFTKVRERIFHKLVHFDKNKDQLEEQPHIRWNDLAVIFYYAMEKKVIEKASITIRNEHMRMWGQTAESLYRIAQENMPAKMPELLVPMSILLEEMTGLNMQSEEQIPMYVLTNQEKMFGASALLYSGKLKGLAEKWQSDLLVLPSSVHEVLLLPDTHEKEYGFYRQMVREVNTTQVEPEEILSENIYRYNRKNEEIEEINS